MPHRAVFVVLYAACVFLWVVSPHLAYLVVRAIVVVAVGIVTLSLLVLPFFTLHE